jgi:hypothetical protein
MNKTLKRDVEPGRAPELQQGRNAQSSHGAAPVLQILFFQDSSAAIANLGWLPRLIVFPKPATNGG